MKKIKIILDQWVNSLTSKEKLIVSFLGLIILMIIYFMFIKNSYRKNEINYDELTVENIVNSSSIIYDRNRIMTLDEIVAKILKVKNKQYIINGKSVSVKDLYEKTVNLNYKKELSYSDFKKKIEKVYENVLLVGSGYNDENYINIVYFSSLYDMYLVKLNTTNQDEIYIGIRIIDDYNYNIVFIE